MSGKHHEKGFALVMVLGLLAVFGIMIGTIIASSQTLRFSVAKSATLNNSVYYTESAVTRTIWLLMNDRMLFQDRAFKPENEQLIFNERYRADTLPHLFFPGEFPVEVKIFDANSGINIAGLNPVDSFFYLASSLEKKGISLQTFEYFKNRIMDYTDADDLLHDGGLERNDYEALGRVPLPRNANMQFSEEIIWIPESEKFILINENGFLKDINLIPPRGLLFPAGKPNFFSASAELIQDKCNISDNELKMILDSRNEVLVKRISIEEAFQHSPLLLAAVKAQFSFTESNCYTLIASPAKNELGFFGKTLIVTLLVNNAPEEYGLRYFQWKIF